LGALERLIIEQNLKNKKTNNNNFFKKKSGFDDSEITQNAVFLKI
jgi:hypothetical protein